MAITLPAAPLVRATDFAAGLDRARRAVFQLFSRDGQPAGSGWLITDTLAVVPDYVLTPAGRFYCAFDDGTPAYPKRDLEVEATPVEAVAESTGEPKSSLLRLARPLPGCAVDLPEYAAAADVPVFILQYPQGSASLNLSFGRVLRISQDRFHYDANTSHGSSGSPVFDANWNLLGVHHWRQPEGNTGGNSGLLLAAVLRHLRESAAWPEIVAYHQLADVAAAATALSRPAVTASAPAAAVRAAVLWKFDPAAFDADARDWLRSRVVTADPKAGRWVLQPGERVKLLHAAGSLDALRAARAAAPPAADAGQRAVDRVLAGPPFDLAAVPTSDLSHWLQAVRWFAAVVPDLPTPAAVNRELGRRRVTERLDRLVGPTFRGRADELSLLHAWDQAGGGPMVLSGIGGVGKSALVAKFAHTALEAGRLVLWLDFDRADLAPDDAVSVLTVLGEQAAAQLDGFPAPPTDPAAWEAAVRGFASELAARAGGKPPLLVLDGFEVAQHFRKHTELWQLLDVLLAAAPATRVLVAGRAPVPGLRLAGREAEFRDVRGLTADEAAAWLRDGGIPDGPVQFRVLELTEGVPLFLRMAVKLVADGVPPDALPDELPKVMVAEYLDARVIDRLIDPLIRPLARGVLALRRVTPDLIGPVLGDQLPPDLDPADAFDRLAQEWAIVENTASAAPELLVRPNVRASTLKLLELQDADAELVRAVNRKAADWYAGRAADDPAAAGEQVYHLLRLGDVDAAAAAWRPGCGDRLVFAVEDLPAGSAAQSWLQMRLNQSFKVGEGLEYWEFEAANRVRDALRRGLDRAVAPILAERFERSPANPLRVYDAYQRYRDGHLAAARELVGAEPDPDGTVGLAQTLFAAWLAERAGDRPAADRHLAIAQHEGLWTDIADSALMHLAVRAARIRLTVDLDAELELLSRLEQRADGTLDAQRLLSPLDVMLGRLGSHLGYPGGFESVSGPGFPIPTKRDELPAFGEQIRQTRSRESDAPRLVDYGAFGYADPDPDGPWYWPDPGSLARPKSSLALAQQLRVLSWRRWKLATADLFLAKSCRLVAGLGSQTTTEEDQLSVAVVATLAAFLGGQPNHYSLVPPPSDAPSGSLPELFGDVVLASRQMLFPVPQEDRRRQADNLERYTYPVPVSGTGPQTALKSWLSLTFAARDSNLSQRFSLPLDSVYPPELRPVFLYLLGPDPLTALVRRVLELPVYAPL